MSKKTELNKSSEKSEESKIPDVSLLLGKWMLEEDESCGDNYPDEIEFGAYNLYKVKTSSSKFLYWQSGDFEVSKSDRIKIQDARDAMEEYIFHLNEDGTQLEIIVSDDCTLKYKRYASEEEE